MKKTTSKLFALVLSLALILTGFGSPALMIANAADENSTVTFKISDTDGAPVSGLSLTVTNVEDDSDYIDISGETASDGTITFDPDERDDNPDPDSEYVLGISGDSDYTMESEVKIVIDFGDTGYIITTVNGEDFDGSTVEATVKKNFTTEEPTEPVTTNVLKVKTVDSEGNAVPNVKLYFDDQYTNFTTGDDGVGTYTIGTYASGTKSVGPANSSGYTSENPLSVKCSMDWNTYSAYIESVNGTAYTGQEITLVVAESDEQPDATTNVLTVKTVDEDGAVVPNVELYFDDEYNTFSTGDDGVGTFTIGSYTSGTKTVNATDGSGYTAVKTLSVKCVKDYSDYSKPAYIESVDGTAYTGQEVTLVVKKSSSTTDPVVDKTSTLKLKVVDQNGDPAEGVAFKLNAKNYGEYSDPLNVVATDANGETSCDVSGAYMGDDYEFAIVSNDTYTYEGSDYVTVKYDSSSYKYIVESVNKTAYDGSVITITVKKAESEPETPDTKTGTLKIRVVDENNEPVEGVNLYFYNKYYTFTSGEDGVAEYELKSYDSGSSIVGVASDNYASDTTFTVVASGDPIKIDTVDGEAYTGEVLTIVVKAVEVPKTTNVLTVKTVDEKGNTVPNIMLVFDGYGEFTTGEDGVGTYTIGENVRGDKMVTVASDSDYSEVSPMTVSCYTNWTEPAYIKSVNGNAYEGETIEFVVKSNAVEPEFSPATVKVRVVDTDGNPVQGLQLQMYNQAGSGYGELNFTDATDEDGYATYTCSNVSYELPDEEYEIRLKDSSEYKATNVPVVYLEEDADGNYISTIDDEEYTGQVVTITVEAATHPELESVSVDKTEVSADGEKVTITVTGKDLPSTIYFKKYYKYYIQDTNSYENGTIDWSAISATADGTSTQRTFEVALPAASTQKDAFAWNIGVSLTSNGTFVKTDDIAITGVEKPELISIKSVTPDKTKISPEGGVLKVTVTGTALPDTAFYRLYTEDGWYVLDGRIVLDGDNTTEKTFEIDIPAASEYLDTTKWAIGVSATRYGTYVQSEDIAVEEEPETELPDRIAGNTRVDTSLDVADQLKAVTKSNKFNTIVVASGADFPDALTGGYLAAVKDAPIVLVTDTTEAKVQKYITDNLADGGKIYILGGNNSVSAGFEKAVSKYDVTRLSGSNRYETNIAILKESGVSNEEILVATGANYADSISASAVGKPILLVGKSLTDSQRSYLGTLTSNQVTALGGTNSVSNAVLNAVASSIGGAKTDRVSGNNRYATSVEIAKKYFGNSVSTVFTTTGKNYPDGLAGGPIAVKLGAPIILVSDNNADNAAAADYCKNAGVTKSIALGGEAVVTEIVRKAMLAN